MKPLVCYVTFNNMVYSVSSLTNLLKCDSDFDLVICDNDSKDHTWKWLQTISDPRIIEMKRFEKNHACLSAANYVITKRKPGQDFCLIENDATVITLEKPFEKMRKTIEDCNLAGVHASLTSFNQAALDRFSLINGHSILHDAIYGMFYRIRSEVMDNLGYYDETTFAADGELNNRVLEKLKLRFAYMADVKINIFSSFDCLSCKQVQAACGLPDHACLVGSGESLNHKFTVWFREHIAARHLAKIGDHSQIYCGSIFAGNLNQQELEHRSQLVKFFEGSYEEFLNRTKYAERFVNTK